MSKIKLMGARHFLEMPKGTIYCPLEPREKEEFDKIIDDFKSGCLKFNFDNLHIYGSNSASMWLAIDEDCEDYPQYKYISWYDANVVGDADPSCTLYFVVDEEWLPNEITVKNDYGDLYMTFTKQEVIEIRDRFVGFYDKKGSPRDNRLDPDNEWAREILTTQYKDDFIANFYCEKEYQKLEQGD